MVAVSIGMPVYNSAKFVRAAIEQLQAQTFRDFELLISDNHSTDGTWEICQEIATDDSRIKLSQHSSNIGAMKNFASVLDRAAGPYFMWAADDDWHHPEFLQSCVNALSRNPKAGLAFCNFTIFNHESASRSPVIAPASTTADAPKEALTVRFKNPVSNLMYGLMPTDVARRYFPYDYFDWADAFMVAQISSKYDVEIIPEELYGAGVKTEIRNPIAADGKKISSGTYFRRAMTLAFQTASYLDGVRLLNLLWRQTVIMDAQTAEAEKQYRILDRNDVVHALDRIKRRRGDTVE
jgi:glycosyltransferase involved in cell wall biosynthesis